MTNYLDVRDLQHELDELTDAREMYTEFLENADADITPKTKAAAAVMLDWDNDQEVRFNTLTSVLEELTEDNSPLIPERNWVEYVQELLQETGDLPKNIPSYIEIDWDKTADNISNDYSTIEIDGITYFYRDN